MRILTGGAELIDVVEPLWLALFDHHLAVGNGGLPGIPRAESAVGYVMAHVFDGPDDTWPTGDLIGEVETLSLLPSERGHGLGTELLDLAEARLFELGAACVWIKTINGNNRAHRFYEARGMTPVITTFIRLP